MNFDGWNNFDDFIKACGYSNLNNDDKNFNNGSQNETNDGNNINNETNEFFNMGCNDIPGGFQCLNPQLFAVVGEIFGDIIAGNLPFNVQNAVGNWLQLVGQVILTYNAQQQYFQGGPGRYFNTKYYNVSNPFCSKSTGKTEGNSSSGNFDYENETNTSSNNNSRNNREKSNIKNNIEDINKLKENINTLMNQVNEINNRINELEKSN